MASTSYLPPVNFRFNVLLLDTLDGAKKNAAMDYLFSDKKSKGARSFRETSFVSVSGLESELQTEEVKVGGVNNYNFNLPTNIKFSNLVLTRGIVTKYSGFIDWYLKNTNNADGKIQKRNLLISLLDIHSTPLIIWLVVDAYPVSWKVNDMNAQNGEVLIEEIKLVYNRFEVIKV